MSSTISTDLFVRIREKYGHYSSWAVWLKPGSTPKSNMDTTIFRDSSIMSQLHTNFILVALNISRQVKIPFGNFHLNYSEATDYKTRFALINTPLWGSYMTDIIKDFEEISSGRMMQFLNNHPEFEKENIKSLLTEIDFIGAKNPILVAIGIGSYKILKRNLGTKFRIMAIPHYANYNSKEKYREQVLTVLKDL